MIKPQSFLGRVTTFVMSVLLVSTFLFPFMSQPAWANEATSLTVQNFETPICTAESRGLGTSQCNLIVNNNNTLLKDLAGAAITSSVTRSVLSSNARSIAGNARSVAGLRAAGSKTMGVLSRAAAGGAAAGAAGGAAAAAAGSTFAGGTAADGAAAAVAAEAAAEAAAGVLPVVGSSLAPALAVITAAGLGAYGAYQGIQGLSSDHEQTTEQTHE